MPPHIQLVVSPTLKVKVACLKLNEAGLLLSPIYTMKKSLRHATHDMSLRHATAMADLYYFVASPVQQVENTHD